MLLPFLVALQLCTLALAAPAQLPFAAHTLPALSSFGLSPAHLSSLEAHIASLPERRLVQLSESSAPIEISEGEKALLVLQSIRFADVTDEDRFLTVQAKQEFPAKLSYESSQLTPLFDHIDIGAMKAFLTKFSGFYNRYYRASTGKQSQAFLLSSLVEIAKSNPKVNVTFSEFPHSWGQNSIIARFEPSSALQSSISARTAEEKIVIIGAHQDSTNLLPFLGAPGADDDGSGTTSALTSFAALVNATFKPSTHPVEFHWYSAEEGGLLGSQAVAQDYARQGKVVRAMLQMDMTAWVKAGTTPTIGTITDFVSPDFTQFIRLLIDEYAEIGHTDTACGYACSDHASWTKVGAPSAFTIESTFADSNHNIHSANDKIDYSPEFSFEHMAQFSRLAISLAVELGGGESLGFE